MGTSISEAIKAERGAILEAWLERVSNGSKAAGLPNAVLLNSVPMLLDEIVVALGDPEPLRAARDISPKAAAAHGEQRLDLGYGVEELGREYNDLRQVILQALDRQGVRLDPEGAAALHTAVDQAHRAGVGQFIVAGRERLSQRQAEFLSRLSHDLRAPLATIFTSAQLAARSPGEPQRRAHLDRITRVAQRLMRMVESQLATEEALAGELRPRLEAVSLREVAEPLIDELREVAAAKGLKLEDRIPDSLKLRTDPMLLGQVLQNLVDNAIKYTERGRVVVGAQRRGESVLLTVEDTGRGLPSNGSGSLFAMYRRAERGSPGHGVGLAVVGTIVAALGGTISVRSEPGRGTRFEVSLPAQPGLQRELPAP